MTIAISLQIHAQVLSERAVYERCHAKLVRMTPDADDRLVAQVDSGALTGAQACQELLSLARMNASGRIPPYLANPEKFRTAQRIVHTMNDVHRSWFTRKTFAAESECSQSVTNSLIDAAEPAYFFTRALFHPSQLIDSAVLSTDSIRAIREVENPRRSILRSAITRPFIGFPEEQEMISNGGLLGFALGSSPMVRLVATDKAPGEVQLPVVASYPLMQNQGGGILGSQAYLLANFGDDGTLFPDLEKMPRNWARYVFRDLLCRELPVIRDEDAAPYRVCDSPECAIQVTKAQMANVLPFRQQNACVKCHASMDQLAGVVRNFRGYRTGTCTFNPPSRFSSYGMVKETPTETSISTWDYKVDVNYRKRPSLGRFLFRTHNNKLINKPIANLDQLGQVIANTEDFYICAAKRYYHYFTGINVDISPLSGALAPDQRFYRARVIDLGRKLKSADAFNKDSLKLIEAIFALPEYKRADFRLLQAAGS